MALTAGVSSKGTSASSASQATTAVTTTPGSTIIVQAEWISSSNFTSIVDTSGNVFTQVGAELSWGGASNKTRVYICINAKGGAGYQVTVALNVATVISVHVLEILGSNIVLVASAQNADGASPFTSPSITPPGATLMLVSGVAGDSGSNPATNAESTGFTIQPGTNETNGAAAYAGALAIRSVTSNQAYSSSFTQIGASNTSVVILALAEIGQWRRLNITNPGKHPGSRKFKPLRCGYVAITSPDVTVALTGTLVNFSAGTLTPSTTTALAGAQYTWSAGTLTPNFTLPLIGSAETYATGTLAPSASVPLVGTQYTWSTGTMVGTTGGDLTLALTGQAYSYSAGTLTPSATVPLTGSSEAYSSGTLTANNALPLTGIAEAYSTGVLAPSTTASLAGQLVAFDTGTMTPIAGGDVTVALTGIAYTWQTDTLTPSGGDTGGGTGNGSGPFFPMAMGVGYDKPKKRPKIDEPAPIVVNRADLEGKSMQEQLESIRGSIKAANVVDQADNEAIEAVIMLLLQ